MARPLFTHTYTYTQEQTNRDGRSRAERCIPGYDGDFPDKNADQHALVSAAAFTAATAADSQDGWLLGHALKVPS